MSISNDKLANDLLNRLPEVCRIDPCPECGTNQWKKDGKPKGRKLDVVCVKCGRRDFLEMTGSP